MARLLTTHAGSLPRPHELDVAWARHSRGLEVDQVALAELVETATAGVLAKQAAAGIDVAGDGEQGRESFFTHVRERFDGFGGLGDLRPFKDIRAFPAYFEQRRALLSDPDSVSLAQVPAAVGEITYRGTAAIDSEIALLKSLAASHDFSQLFVTVPSPGIIATAMTNRHYDTIEQYIDVLAEGLANEYRAVVDAGLILQIDAPDLALERHVLYGDRPLADFVAFARHVIAAINRALRPLDRHRVRLHVCWGNYDGPHSYDVDLGDMLETYAAADVGAIVLSLANPRHAHEYRLLSELPPEMSVVAGSIDTTTNYVEHPRVVADRLLRAVEAIGDPARVMAGTDCGFATAAGMRDVAPDVAWAKLAALTEGARNASDLLSLA